MIDIQNLTACAGDFQLKDFSLQVEEGTYAVLMGKTGCGKTTLLEAVCGLKRVRQGVIRIGGEDVTRLRPCDRGIGYVPQEGALFQTMSVRENLAFGLWARKVPKAEFRQRAEEIAAELGIAHLLDRKPHGLSGGERQRVALGRALAICPKVLCLDEPLSALDDDTREEIAELIIRLRKSQPFTAIHVTHSIREAERLGDVVVRMGS